MALSSEKGACAEEVANYLLHLAFLQRLGLQLFNFPRIYLYRITAMVIAKL